MKTEVSRIQNLLEEVSYSGDVEKLEKVLAVHSHIEVDWKKIFYNVAFSHPDNCYQYPKETASTVRFYNKYRRHINLSEIFDKILNEDVGFINYSDEIVSVVINAHLTEEVKWVASRIIATMYLTEKIEEERQEMLLAELQSIFPKELSKEFLAELSVGVTL